MEKKQYSMRLATHKPGAEDHVGKALQDRPQQHIVLPGVIFQVCILDHQKVARGMSDACMKGSPFPLILFVAEQLDRHGRIGSHVVFEAIKGIVGGTVIHHHDLLVQTGCQFHIPDFIQDEMNGPLFVVDRDDDGEFLVHGETGMGFRQACSQHKD